MFMKGKLKIKGNIMLAQKLGTLFKSASATTTSAKTSAAPAKEAPSGKQMAADKIFEEIRLKMQEKPDLAKSINAVYAFQISKDDATKIFGNYRFYSKSNSEMI